MKGAIRKISINGYKSIRELKEFELRDLNIIIGANGSGKSNLVQVFQLLMAMSGKGMQKFILENGGADNFLHNGPRNTPAILMEFHWCPVISQINSTGYGYGYPQPCQQSS